MITKYTLPEYDFPVFDNWGSILIVLFGLMVYIVLVKVYLIEKKYIKEHAPGHSKWPARIGLSLIAVINTVVIAFVIVLAVWGYQSTIQEYETVVEGYHRGEYLVVEGEVENFSPMPKAGHGIESFTVNDVDFEYTFYEVQYSYHQPLVEGGVIEGDGQYVRIGYIELEGRNHIVLIETRAEQ